MTGVKSPPSVTFKLLSAAAAAAAAVSNLPLHVWTTVRGRPFEAGPPITPSTAGEVTVPLPAEAVVSVSTVGDAAHVELDVPPRTSFPFPCACDSWHSVMIAWSCCRVTLLLLLHADAG